MTVICSKENCPYKIGCQHGKPHEPVVNCEATLCGFGGEVKCVPYQVGNGERFGSEEKK